MTNKPMTDEEIIDILKGSENNFDSFCYSLIPERLLNNIRDYVNDGEPLCGFLYAIFINDLKMTVGAADSQNINLIPVYVRYIHNNCPWNCHGGREAVEEWMKMKQGKIHEKNSPEFK